MSIPVNVVVTCTNRKRHDVPEQLQMRNVAADSISERAREWSRRLQSHAVPKVPASRLYAGEHWAVVQALPDQAAGLGYASSIWIASAGHGLIDYHEDLPPYAATLSARQPDSVIANGDDPAEWWRELTRVKGSSDRSVTALARRFPSRPLLLAISPPYLRAMADDIAGAAQCLESPSLLAVLCAGSARVPSVESFRVPCNAKLQHAAGGGTRVSLNVRLVKLALEQAKGGSPTRERITERFAKLIESAKPLALYDRKKLDDDDVRAFIRTHLKESPRSSKTTLLRKLRDAGKACEQARFGGLFVEEKRAMHES